MSTFKSNTLELWFVKNKIELGQPFYQNGNRGSQMLRHFGTICEKPVFIQIPKAEIKQNFIEEYAMRQFLKRQGVATPTVLLLDIESGTVVEEYKGDTSLCKNIVVRNDYIGPITLYILLKQDVQNESVIFSFMEQARAELSLCRAALVEYFTQAKKTCRHSPALFESFYEIAIGFIKGRQQEHLHTCIAQLRQSSDFEIIKGDSGAGNFLLEETDNKLYIIDFEEAGTGYKWQDEVRLLFTSGLCLPKSTVLALAEHWGLLNSCTALSQMCILCALRWTQAALDKQEDSANEYSCIFQVLEKLHLNCDEIKIGE